MRHQIIYRLLIDAQRVQVARACAETLGNSLKYRDYVP